MDIRFCFLLVAVCIMKIVLDQWDNKYIYKQVK